MFNVQMWILNFLQSSEHVRELTGNSLFFSCDYIPTPVWLIAGLLALYLCTRNCCGVILNLFFSSAAVGCGVGLYLSGFSRSLGIMFIIVGLLMMVVIVLALIYHKLTGKPLLWDTWYMESHTGTHFADHVFKFVILHKYVGIAGKRVICIRKN